MCYFQILTFFSCIFAQDASIVHNEPTAVHVQAPHIHMFVIFSAQAGCCTPRPTPTPTPLPNSLSPRPRPRSSRLLHTSAHTYARAPVQVTATKPTPLNPKAHDVLQQQRTRMRMRCCYSCQTPKCSGQHILGATFCTLKSFLHNATKTPPPFLLADARAQPIHNGWLPANVFQPEEQLCKTIP